MPNRTPRAAARLGLAGIALALSLGVSARAETAPEVLGERVAQRYCAVCHAVGRRGDSPNAGAPRFRELHRRFAVDDLEERLFSQLMTHHTDMPQFRLSMEELRNLIAYLKAVQNHSEARAAPSAGERAAGG